MIVTNGIRALLLRDIVKTETMSTTKSTLKLQADRLTLIEEMLFLKEVSDTVRFLETEVMELNGKVVEIDVMGNRLDGLPIKELMFRVASLEERVAPTSSSRPAGSPDSSVAHKEGTWRRV